MSAIPSQAPETRPAPSSLSNSDFANEIRADRLNLLWRVTAWLGGIILWFAFVQREEGELVITSIGLFILVGSLITGRLVKRELYTLGVWTLAGSLLLASVVPMVTYVPLGMNVAPFFFPLLVLLVGVMLPPAHLIVMMVITILANFLTPFAVTGDLSLIGPYQLWAAFFSVLAALLAIQTTGDLFQITGWALDNYSRERRTSHELFDKRRELEKSLLRSEVLGEKLTEINQELETAKHFRGQFLANMSHELRTPLNAIIGFSETMLSFPMMYDDVDLPETYRKDLKQIHNSGQQLLTVINDILDLSRVDAGKLEVNLRCVELDPLIDSVMMTAAGLVANKPVMLERDLPPVLPDVFADEARLRQVLLNLYSNAAKFSDEGTITIGFEQDEREVRLSVRDTGSGIEADKLEEIFEEFSQVQNKGRDPRAGAGLGLTISRRLINLMNGRIWAESTLGEGSTFCVAIPKFDQRVHRPTDPKPPGKITQPRKVTI